MRGRGSAWGGGMGVWAMGGMWVERRKVVHGLRMMWRTVGTGTRDVPKRRQLRGVPQGSSPGCHYYRLPQIHAT